MRLAAAPPSLVVDSGSTRYIPPGVSDRSGRIQRVYDGAL